jgi:hypothetical protein
VLVAACLLLAGQRAEAPLAGPALDEAAVVKSSVGWLDGLPPVAMPYPAGPQHVALALGNAVALGVTRGPTALRAALDGRWRELPDVHASYILGFHVDPGPWFLAARLLSIAAALAALLLVTSGERGRWGVPAALFAGATLVFSPTFVEVGREARPDALLLTLTLLALAAIDRMDRRGDRRDALVAGASCGLATCEKVPGVVTLVAFVAAHVANRRRAGATWRQAMCDAALWQGLGVAIATFLLTCPWVVTDWAVFLKGLTIGGFGLIYFHGNEPAVVAWSPLTLLRALVHGTGWPLALFGLGALVVGIVRRQPWPLAHRVFAAAYLLLILPSRTVYPSYALPVIPILALAAWSSLDAMVSRVRSGQPVVRAVLVVALLAAPAVATLSAFPERLLPSTGRAVRDALLREAQPGDVVMLDPWSPPLPGPPDGPTVTYDPVAASRARGYTSVALVEPISTLDRYDAWRARYLGESGPPSDRRLPLRVRPVRLTGVTADDLAALEAGRVRWVIQAPELVAHALNVQGPEGPHAHAERLLERRGRRVAVFRSADGYQGATLELWRVDSGR